MMSVIYAGIMLLWFWGTGKKKAFYARKNIKLTNFLALMDAGDGKGKDHQNSMTIAQQNIALRASSTKLKRIRGALPASPYSPPSNTSSNWISGCLKQDHRMPSRCISCKLSCCPQMHQ